MARGEETAFHEFYRLYFNRLLRYLLVAANGQEEIAREALQLTFLRVARHVRRFETEPAFWNWLTVLARSAFTDEIRKRSRYQGLLARFFQTRTVEAELYNDADARFEELLSSEMAKLPVEDRELLEQKYFNGESVRHLASNRQMTGKAMESHLLRIRRKLKASVLERLKNETSE
jgi:RNA polymerase sigma factor (sigma-70 family)